MTLPQARTAVPWTEAGYCAWPKSWISRSASRAVSVTSDSAEQVLMNGADKISINSPALANPDLIGELARRFGSQCVVVGIDSSGGNGEWRVHELTRRPFAEPRVGPQYPGLGQRSSGPRRRRNRAQLHE